MAVLRTFVAIEMEQGILTRLEAVQRILTHCTADVSWTRPESMHLTLTFLGDIDETRIAAIGDALVSAVAGFAPFTLRVSGTGGFPSLRRPRVLWAGVGEGALEVTALALAVDDALAALALPREQRPFPPHLTLGRVKSATNLAPLTQLVAQLADEELGEMLVREICFIRSELLPQGARYTVLRRIPLVQGGRMKSER